MEIIKRYARRNAKTWSLLETQTTIFEYALANKMAKYIRDETNNLDGLNDKTSMIKKADLFGISRKTIGKLFDKLFELGVIRSHNSEWVFNPYLSTDGNKVDKEIVELFNDTFYAKMGTW